MKVDFVDCAIVAMAERLNINPTSTVVGVKLKFYNKNQAKSSLQIGVDC